MRTFRAVVSILSVAIVLQAQCFALCAAMPWKDAPTRDETPFAGSGEVPPASCHGSPAGESHNDPASADGHCAWPHGVESQKAASVFDIHASLALVGAAIDRDVDVGVSKRAFVPEPTATSVLRSVRATVLRI